MGLPLQSQSESESFGFGRGPPPQGQQHQLRVGPPLQGDFVRRVVPRPAPTRGRGTSGLHTNAIRSDEIPLQRRPSPGGVSWFRWATATAKAPHSAGAPARRSLGPQRGERRGGAGIGRKQAMDGLRSPVGAMDGATRRCARSPHYRGSTRRQWAPALYNLVRSGITRSDEDLEKARRGAGLFRGSGPGWLRRFRRLRWHRARWP